jgi:hypothetical protein
MQLCNKFLPKNISRASGTGKASTDSVVQGGPQRTK